MVRFRMCAHLCLPSPPDTNEKLNAKCPMNYVFFKALAQICTLIYEMKVNIKHVYTEIRLEKLSPRCV